MSDTPPPPPPPPPPSPSPTPPSGPDQFSAGDSIGYGWKRFTENVGPILLALLVYFLVGIVIYAVLVVLAINAEPVTTVDVGPNGEVVTQTETTGGLISLLLLIVGTVVYFIYAYVVQAGLARGGLAITEGRKLELRHMFSLDKIVAIVIGAIILSLPSIIAGAITGISASGGTLTIINILNILLNLLQIVLAVLGLFYIFFILDQDLGAIDSIKASFTLVREHLGKVVLLLLLCLLVALAGALLCGIGLFVAVPVVVIAQTYAYKVLRGQPVAS